MEEIPASIGVMIDMIDVDSTIISKEILSTARALRLNLNKHSIEFEFWILSYFIIDIALARTKQHRETRQLLVNFFLNELTERFRTILRFETTIAQILQARINEYTATVNNSVAKNSNTWVESLPWLICYHLNYEVDGRIASEHPVVIGDIFVQNQLERTAKTEIEHFSLPSYFIWHRISTENPNILDLNTDEITTSVAKYL